MKIMFAASLVLASLLSYAEAHSEPEAVQGAATNAPSRSEQLASIRTEIAKIQDPARLGQLAEYFRAEGDDDAELAALDRRIQLRPHIGQYKLDKAVALARRDQKSAAYTTLIELQNTGYGYDLRDDSRFSKIATTEVWGYVVDNFDANRKHFGEGKLFDVLPAEDLLVESLAWDSTRDALLVGSAREGVIYSLAKGGKLKPLIRADKENGMWAVFDFAVDAERGLVWVASTAVPHFKDYDARNDLGRAGIFKFDLKSGKFIKSYLSPVVPGQNFVLSTIALGADGAVYAADGVNNAIYQVRDDQFRRILHAPHMTNISALTMSGDGKSLYFSDVERGIFGVDLSTLKPFDVRVPQRLTLESISSLKWYDNSLIAVQGRMQPPRVMRFDLSSDGRSIAGIEPLEVSNPMFGHVGVMALNGADIYLIANSQMDNYDRYGLVKNKDKLEGVRILKIDANYKPQDTQGTVAP